MSNNSTSTYCVGLETASTNYLSVHGFVSVTVCIAGAFSNALSLAVLARPALAAPASTILSALAAADVLVMLEYIPFALHTYVLTSRPRGERYSYPWAIYVLFHANFTQVFHTISIWLTVTLAVWRYMAVYHSDMARVWCSTRRTRAAVIAAYFGSALLCAPLYLAFSVSKRADGTYVVGMSELALANKGVIITANFWIYSVVMKLIPCVLLSILSQRLVAAIWENKRRRRSLLNKEDKDGDRTSRLLMVVLMLFLVTELPQGVLGLLSVVLGEEFFTSCYARLGELMDLLALATSTLNFPLYCVMSSQFRAEFTTLIKRVFSVCCKSFSYQSTSTLTSDELTERKNISQL